MSQGRTGDARPSSIPGVLCLLALLCALASPARAAVPPTNAADNLRTGWYPDQPGLDPSIVSGPSFGRLFSASVEGQVYAQPLVWAGTLLVVTEDNWVYGLDPATGLARWPRFNVGRPWNATDLSCSDLEPHVGITGTPVIDPATNLAYFAAKSYDDGDQHVRWDLHAIDVTSGHEAAGYPVALTGRADNGPTTFDARQHLQRPGLLLLDGVVYAGFGGHCDRSPWQGWVFGVSTATHAITARWLANSDGSDGAGIWQSGGGLVSDGPGEILLTTGNGSAPSSPHAGSPPPATLGEALVRLHVGPDGKLVPTDFFAPYDADVLDQWDADFGSTAPTVLPPEHFGGRRLIVAAGKFGNFYLLDGDHLGGIGRGAGGGDDVLQQVGPLGGVWSRLAVWPGNGGWVYEPTAGPNGTSGIQTSGRLLAFSYGEDARHAPRFTIAGGTAQPFGFGSGAPVVTSDGVRTGSALVWIVRTANGYGDGAELQAYDPVPVDDGAGNGVLPLRRGFAIGSFTKFTPPGIAGGRVYVGTRDGRVLGYGVPAEAPLTGTGVTFPETIVGDPPSHRTVTLTAARALTIDAVHVSGPFSAGTPSATVLAAGDTVTIDIAFAPTTWSLAGGTLTLDTSEGQVAVGLSGEGRARTGKLVASAALLRFGGVVPDQTATRAVTIANVGATAVTIEQVAHPASPFQDDGGPEPDDVIAPGERVTISVTFAPHTIGRSNDELRITSSAAGQPSDTVTIGLTANAVTPAHLTIEPASLDFGGVELGTTTTRTIRLTNTGGATMTFTKSKPPALGVFVPAAAGAADGNPIPEGTQLDGGASVDLVLSFSPTTLGPAADEWLVNGTDDGGGVRSIAFTGTGTVPVPPGGGGGDSGTPGPPKDTPTPVVKPTPRTAPIARFVARTVQARTKLRVGVRLRCPSTSKSSTCRGTLVLRALPPRGKRLGTLLGHATFTIRRGRVATVQVSLSRRALRSLTRWGLLRGRASITPRGGRAATQTVAFSVRPPLRTVARKR